VLKVSQKLEYAMRAMIELANRRSDRALVPAREIAERGTFTGLAHGVPFAEINGAFER